MNVSRRTWLVVCASTAATAAAARPALAEADKVRIAIAAVYPPFSVPFAAQELGYYKALNLDAEITVYPGGGPAQEAMAAGAVDLLTNSPAGAALAISKGVKQHIVAMTGSVTPSGWYVVVAGDSAVKTLKDLDGKTVGVSAKGSSTDFMALAAAKRAGITVKTIPLGQALSNAVLSHQVDAGIFNPFLAYKAILDEHAREVADLGKLLGPVVPDTWVASDKLINERPDVLRRTLRANLRAVDYMQRNERWALPFLSRYLDNKDERVLKLVYDNTIKPLRTDGLVKAEWLRGSLELASLVGLPAAASVDRIFDPKFVPISLK